MEVRKGYKQTELGIIPTDWKTVPLEKLTIKIGSGITPTGGERVYKKEGRPFTRSQNVGWGMLLLDDIVFIDEQTHATFPSTEIKLNDVLLNITGASIGRSAVANSRLQGGNVNQHVCIIRVDANSLDPNFLNLFLLSRNGQKQIESFQGGGNRQGLNFGQIKSFQIILPPTLAEQEAIAKALSDADALIAAVEQLLAKKRQVKQGAMQGLLTGKKRLPGFSKKTEYKQTEVGIIPEEWQVKTLTKVCLMKSGESITSASIDQFSEYPCYGGNGLRGFTSRFTHEGKYALVGRQGALCGNVLGVEGKFFASEHAIVVTALVETDIQWLTYILGEMRLNQYSESSAQPGLSVSKILSLPLAVPPTKNEQTAIAEILSDMDAEISALEGKLSKARQVKAGMMSMLLTGRVRLV